MQDPIGYSTSSVSGRRDPSAPLPKCRIVLPCGLVNPRTDLFPSLLRCLRRIRCPSDRQIFGDAVHSLGVTVEQSGKAVAFIDIVEQVAEPAEAHYLFLPLLEFGLSLLCRFSGQSRLFGRQLAQTPLRPAHRERGLVGDEIGADQVVDASLCQQRELVSQLRQLGQQIRRLHVTQLHPLATQAVCANQRVQCAQARVNRPIEVDFAGVGIGVLVRYLFLAGF
ncbi:hypothetical protein IU486_32305 [Streptomyces gardneri]|nr:hypothetical protein [Streptomyces gardneri]